VSGSIEGDNIPDVVAFDVSNLGREFAALAESGGADTRALV
jgi:hypothetical protein